MTALCYMDVVVFQPWFGTGLLDSGDPTSPGSSTQFLARIGWFGQVIPTLTATFFALNVYWFGLLLSGALAVLKKKKA